MSVPYRHTRFRWDRPVDLNGAAAMLRGRFGVEELKVKREGTDKTSNKERRVVKIESDTICATLDPYRAIIAQREARPFTSRDLLLRSALIDLYDKLGPFNSEPIPEPGFEVEE